MFKSTLIKRLGSISALHYLHIDYIPVMTDGINRNNFTTQIHLYNNILTIEIIIVTRYYYFFLHANINLIVLIVCINNNNNNIDIVAKIYIK